MVNQQTNDLVQALYARGHQIYLGQENQDVQVEKFVYRNLVTTLSEVTEMHHDVKQHVADAAKIIFEQVSEHNKPKSQVND